MKKLYRPLPFTLRIEGGFARVRDGSAAVLLEADIAGARDIPETIRALSQIVTALNFHDEFIRALEYYAALDQGENPLNLPDGARAPKAQFVLQRYEAFSAQEGIFSK